MVLGTALRFIQFPNNPPGLFTDEASAGYESLSLLRTGADRWSDRFPAYFVASGTGQNTLHSYLTIPLVALLGLNRFSARLLDVILGILTIPVVFVGVKKRWGTRAALLATGLLAIMPWHVMISRWANDSNPLPFFLLLGAWTVSRALSNPNPDQGTLLALVPWALGFYAYVVSVTVTPLWMALVCLFYFRAILSHWKLWLGSLAVFGLISLPMALFLLRNFVVPHALGIEQYLPFGIEPLPYSRLAQITSPLPERLQANLLFVVSGFQDGDIRHGVPDVAPMFVVLFPLVLVGAISLVRRLRRTGEADLFLLWLVACLPLFVLFDRATHRINAIIIPFLVVGVVGFWGLWDALVSIPRARRVFAVGVAVLIAVQASAFAVDYFLIYPARIETTEAFFNNFDRALAKGVELADPNDEILVSTARILPETLTAFFSRYPPEDYQRDVRYNNRYGQLTIESFGRFYFDAAYLPECSHFTFVYSKFAQPPCESPQVQWQTRLWQVGQCSWGNQLTRRSR